MSRRLPDAAASLVFVLAALFTLALLPACAGAEKRWLRCDYVELGPPGPVGNSLEIAGSDNAQVRRKGDLILVGTSAGNGPRDFEEVFCGTQATVTNVDRIVYRGAPVRPRREHQFLLDLRDGALMPGATPEAVDPEIEVEVVLPPQPAARPRVQLLSGDERDTIQLHAGAGLLEVSLEPWPSLPPWRSGFTPDADIAVSAPRRTVELKVHASGGTDVLDGRGLDRNRSLARSVLLAGDDGKDTLLGTARNDQLQGGSGPDRLYGRGGRDFLFPSAGRDATAGGSGPDFISGNRGSAERDTQPDSYYGGEGDDYIDARRGGADTIACGAGTDTAATDPQDTLRGKGCERR